MKTLKKTKLKLNKETVRTLSSNELTKVAGGGRLLASDDTSTRGALSVCGCLLNNF